jgi:hypothetical protein
MKYQDIIDQINEYAQLQIDPSSDHIKWPPTPYTVENAIKILQLLPVKPHVIECTSEGYISFGFEWLDSFADILIDSDDMYSVYIVVGDYKRYIEDWPIEKGIPFDIATYIKRSFK